MKLYIFIFFILETTSCIYLDIHMHNYGKLRVNSTFCASCLALNLISNRLERSFLIHKPQDLQWETEYLLCKFENFMGKSNHICPHWGLVLIQFSSSFKFTYRFSIHHYLLSIQYLLCKFENSMGKSSQICPHWGIIQFNSLFMFLGVDFISKCKGIAMY